MSKGMQEENFDELTDEAIILIRKTSSCLDPFLKWGNTLVFARAIIAAAQRLQKKPLPPLPP